jgi:polyhydroxybutyrate depolymerase
MQHRRIMFGPRFLASVLLPLSVAGTVAACATGSAGNPTTSSPTPTVSPSPSPSATPTGNPTATPAPSSCVTDVSAGDHAFVCDGFTYDVHVPAACAGGGCGLVLDVHGLTMDAAMEDANTGMRAHGDQFGFVIVQPNANPAPPAASWSAADYDKVFAFVQLGVTSFAIDANRVHMTGFSQGGLMTFAFVCAHADVFASVAAGAAAGIGCSFTGTQIPSREVPILQMHGTVDALVNFTTTGIPQRDAVLSAWNMDAGSVIAGDAHFTRTRYTNPSGTVLEFLQHDYSSPQAILRGHCYPGSSDPGGAQGQLFSFACTPPNSFDWGVEAMAFFIAHPRH